MEIFHSWENKGELCYFPGLLQGNPLDLGGKMDGGQYEELGSWQIGCYPPALVNGEAGPYQHPFTVRGRWEEVGSKTCLKRNFTMFRVHRPALQQSAPALSCFTKGHSHTLKSFK